MAIFPYGTTLTRGTVIDERFTVVKKLGQGGMGSVYLCEYNLIKNHRVAMKFLETSEEVGGARFRREVRTMIKGTANVGRTRSHIVRYLDHGVYGGKNYLVMDFVEGGSLADVIEKGVIGARDAVWAMLQVIWGLRQAGVVHRDLKPENLLIEGGMVKADDCKREKWEGGMIKVADFGLAKGEGSENTMELTKSGQAMGTPYYMSPEQARGTKRCDERTDIYAIGCMLYEMVTGKVPFDGESPYEILVMQCNDGVRYPRGIDERLKVIIGRCMEKDRDARYPNLKVLESELRRYLGMEEVRGGWLSWLGM